MIFLHDITERKQAERAIADEHSRLQALIKSSRDGLALIGMDRVVQVVNASALQMLRLPDQPEGRLSIGIGAQMIGVGRKVQDRDSCPTCARADESVAPDSGPR